jgi:hypothetical protein
MLVKLMKHELKANSRLLVPLYLILLAISLVNRFVFNLKDYNAVVTFIKQFSIVTYGISMFIILAVTALYMIFRFYKNLLTDEGYLMFTLPVKTHQLITSKLVLTLFWIIISILAVPISLYIAFATPETLPFAMNVVKEALTSLYSEFGANGVLMLMSFILMCLLSLASYILLVYLSIAVGQLFSKHKIIGSFGAYMVIYTVIQFVVLIIFALLQLVITDSMLETLVRPQVLMPIVLIVLTAQCSAFYLAANRIFKRKLNLD